MTADRMTPDGIAPESMIPSSPASGRVFRADGPLPAREGLLRIGTRGSALAVAQTTTVAERVAAATGTEVGLVIITTHGDTAPGPLAQLGGTGVFVSALRDALLAGACDLAVHSLKDLPTGPCAGIALGAIPERADASDALCARDGMTLHDLPPGAEVGTGSPRRSAQLLARRPDLRVRGLRGNVDTRLGRVGNGLDAVVLASAGLDRIGRAGAITERFTLDEVPTAPGQGALAVEVREADLGRTPYAAALAALDDPVSRACAVAERALLAELEAGCAAPVGATAAVAGGELRLFASVYGEDGRERVTAEAVRPWDGGAAADPGLPDGLGRAVAQELLRAGAARLAQLGETG